jgi:hypothetical protein
MGGHGLDIAHGILAGCPLRSPALLLVERTPEHRGRPEPTGQGDAAARSARQPPSTADPCR